MNNTAAAVELIVGIVAIISVLYQVARVERIIYQAIDSSKDAAERNYLELQRRLDLHIQSYIDRHEHDVYIVNGLSSKIDHKFERLREHQKDIEKFLEKNNNFRVRGYFGSEREDPRVE